MQAFEIFFLNNGSAVFQTENFCHSYDSMEQLADDFAEYQRTGTTNSWEGDEPEFRMEYSRETECNGSYFCVTDGCWYDLRADWGRNTEEFVAALAKTGFNA